MKKIIITGMLVAIAACADAQQGYIGSAKTLTPEEANKLSPAPQTTINGKPYSQYKAEQQANNQQRIAQTKVVLFTDVANNGGAIDTKTTVVENQENSGAKTTPVSHKLVISEINAAVTAVEVKTQSNNQEKGDGAATTKVAEASKVKVEVSRTEATTVGVQAPQPIMDASKTGQGNGSGDTKEVKSTDQKPVETKEPAGNSPSTNKTKTD